MLVGIIQLIIGFAKTGIVAYFFPSSVIYGMLAEIEILIFMKQIPYAFGYDKNPEGNFSFLQIDGQNTITELWNILDYISPGALIISVVSLIILVLWGPDFLRNLNSPSWYKGH